MADENADAPAASKVTAAKEKVKESLIGVEDDQQQPSDQIREEFMRHAAKDQESGELYMGEAEFVNAIAPVDEDYVSTAFPSLSRTQHVMHKPSASFVFLVFANRGYKHVANTTTTA